MLRWYPASWRDRYGAELDAMIEDSLEGEQPTVHFRWSIMRAGLSERLRGAGLIGATPPPAGRLSMPYRCGQPSGPGAITGRRSSTAARSAPAPTPAPAIRPPTRRRPV